MLKYVDYDILFQEIPDEVTLAINLSRCPYRCKGCHSPQLQSDIGEELNEEALLRLLQRYGKSVTCICFMGGGCRSGTSLLAGDLFATTLGERDENSLVFRKQGDL